MSLFYWILALYGRDLRCRRHRSTDVKRDLIPSAMNEAALFAPWAGYI